MKSSTAKALYDNVRKSNAFKKKKNTIENETTIHDEQINFNEKRIEQKLRIKRVHKKNETKIK